MLKHTEGLYTFIILLFNNNILIENYGKMIEASDGYALVYPEHKFLIVEAYRRFIYIYHYTFNF